MTLRMKLARWIGGRELENERMAVLAATNISRAWYFKHRKALQAIAALETPIATNVTVRKMARIAREALE